MSRISQPTHPETGILHRFVLGQISGEEMDRVARHLSGCDPCARVAESLPGDHLLGLLRRPSAGVAEVKSGHSPMTFGLALLAGMILLAGSGCSEVGSVTVDPNVKQRGPLPDTSIKPTGGNPIPQNPGTGKKLFAPG